MTRGWKGSAAMNPANMTSEHSADVLFNLVLLFNIILLFSKVAGLLN